MTQPYSPAWFLALKAHRAAEGNSERALLMMAEYAKALEAALGGSVPTPWSVCPDVPGGAPGCDSPSPYSGETAKSSDGRPDSSLVPSLRAQLWSLARFHRDDLELLLVLSLADGYLKRGLIHAAWNRVYSRGDKRLRGVERALLKAATNGG